MKYEIQKNTLHVLSLSTLINLAYRGTEGARRWTTEHDLVAGDRITPEAIEALIYDPAVMFIAGFEEGQPVCCIAVKKKDKVIELGTFAVAPELQGQGIGKAIIAHAEQLVAQEGKPYEVSVVNRNTALIEFYLKRGYRETGKTRPYPIESNVGIPKIQDLALIVLTKPV